MTLETAPDEQFLGLMVRPDDDCVNCWVVLLWLVMTQMINFRKDLYLNRCPIIYSGRHRPVVYSCNLCALARLVDHGMTLSSLWLILVMRSLLEPLGLLLYGLVTTLVRQSWLIPLLLCSLDRPTWLVRQLQLPCCCTMIRMTQLFVGWSVWPC